MYLYNGYIAMVQLIGALLSIPCIKYLVIKLHSLDHVVEV